MDTEQASEQARRQRELRRKKILENAKSRMDKLKRFQERSSSSQLETDVADGEPAAINHAVPEHYMEDPPDEIIERVRPSIYSQSPHSEAIIPPASQPSFLCSAVATIRSDGAFQLRTLIAVLYSLILTVVTELYALSFSYIVTMLIMEVTLLVSIAVMSKSDGSSVRGDWILQIKGILAFLHPLLPDIFEIVYLSLYIIAIVLRDLVIMIFSVVVFKSIAAIFVQS